MLWASPQGDSSIFIASSGHRYERSGITPWATALTKVLSDPLKDLSESVVVTAIGVDVDSAEAVARRAFDLLVGVLSAGDDSLTDEDLAKFLAERSEIWRSW